jgi:hypothetical protein
MTSSVRIVLTNGSSKKCKIIGRRMSWLIVQRKHRRVYYPLRQIRTINYRAIEEFGFDSGPEGMEVSA